MLRTSRPPGGQTGNAGYHAAQFEHAQRTPPAMVVQQPLNVTMVLPSAAESPDDTLERALSEIRESLTSELLAGVKSCQTSVHRAELRDRIELASHSQFPQE